MHRHEEVSGEFVCLDFLPVAQTGRSQQIVVLHAVANAITMEHVMTKLMRRCKSLTDAGFISIDINYEAGWRAIRVIPHQYT